MKTLFITLKAFVYMTGFLFVFGWIASAVRTFDQFFGIMLPAWVEMLGITFIVLGVILVLMCAWEFIL